MKTNVIRIFISSTFHDMQEERDYILNNIYPRLRCIAEDNCLKLVFVDLRWGILNEAEVITTCFKEIDNSRPFFIGILGHRYGSCAKYQDVIKIPTIRDEYSWLVERLRQSLNNPCKEISYTELEFLYGFLEQTRKDLRVLLLAKEPYSLDAPDISVLKEKILKDGRYPIHPYSKKEELGEIIESAIEKLIEEIKPEVPIDRIDAAIFRQNYQIEQYISNFIRSKAYNKLLSLFLTKFPKNHLFLYGDEGCGKTAFLANLYNDIKSKTNTNALFCSLDFIANPTCTQLAYILDKLLSTYIAEEKTDINNINKERTIVDSFKKKQLLLQTQMYVYVFVDAVDKLKEDDRLQLYGIIRDAPINIRYVLSYSHQDDVLKYIIPNYLRIIFPPYSEIEIENVISSYLPQYGKKLLSEKKSEIAHSAYSKNLFLLRLWLDNLLAYGYFRGLDGYITEMAQSENNQQFLEKNFARFEKTYGYKTVASVLCTIAISPYGVNKNDLITILGCPSNTLLRIVGAFQSLLMIQDDLYVVSHIEFIKFIQKRYEKIYHEIVGIVISYFEDKKTNYLQ